MPQSEAVQVQLQNQLASLLKRVGNIEADLQRSHDRDSEEQATERENDEVLSGLDAITLNEIARIRGALARIADGTYGMCMTCGRAIGEERLVALPGALLCVACASEVGKTA